jgi:transcriptional regulator with XRE-family HTH domain
MRGGSKPSWVQDVLRTEEGQRLFERERVWVETTEHICRLMEQENVSRAELARRLGKTPAYVTKLLRGTQNLTLGTVSDVAFVLGRSLSIRFTWPAESTMVLGVNGWSTEDASQAWRKLEDLLRAFHSEASHMLTQQSLLERNHATASSTEDQFSVAA